MSDLQIEFRLRIEKDENPFLGMGRVQLLDQIDKTGSISKAASAMGMSYRKAWGLIKDMNDIADIPLVLSRMGGSDGGGAKLTPKGKTIIKEFRSLEQQTKEFLENAIKEYKF